MNNAHRELAYEVKSTFGVCSLIVFAVMPLLLTPGNSYACDPPTNAPRTVKERLEASDTVFLGTPVSYENDGLLERIMGMNKQRVTFRVSKQWKGEKVKTIEVYDDSTSCGLGFASMLNSASVLIYGKFRNGLVKPHIAGGAIFYTRPGVSEPFTAAREEIDKLDSIVRSD